MPERKIINYPGAVHFVTFSTHQRRKFLSPERTRFIVMETLEECLTRHHAACHGFVIMPDHVHALLSVAESTAIESFLLAWKKTSSYRIKRFYAQELTHYHDLCPRDGAVWQARFYDFLVESDEKLPEKIQYMHDNPVSAGLAAEFLHWKWSSARFYELEENVGVTITPLR
jgi:putative transposase